MLHTGSGRPVKPSPPLPDVPSTDTLAAAGGGDGSITRILVPVDGTGASAAAQAVANRLCATASGSSMLRVVHVRIFDPPLRGAGRFYPETSATATQVLDQAVSGAWASGSRASGVVVDAQRGWVPKAIAASAAAWNADLIVVARRPRRALTRLLFGSITDQVMRRSGCPVLVVRSGRA